MVDGDEQDPEVAWPTRSISEMGEAPDPFDAPRLPGQRTATDRFRGKGGAAPRTDEGAGVDAPIAADLFADGGYEDMEALGPPTEEVPAQVMEDVGQPYSTPFNVPDPPPIPGIVDRFTPPPAQRTEIGSRRKKSEYLAETPQAKGRYQPTPAPIQQRPIRGAEPLVREERVAAPPPPRVSAFTWSIGILSLLFGVLGVVTFTATVVLMFAQPAADELPPEREVVSDGVDVHENVQTDEVDDGQVPEVPKPAPGEAPTPASGGTPPKPGPAPDPKAAAPEPTKPPAPAKPEIKVRSNRRVLIYIDTDAAGYPPISVPVEPGRHRVTAQIPGQPSTLQAREVVVAPNATVVPVDFSF